MRAHLAMTIPNSVMARRPAWRSTRTFDKLTFYDNPAEIALAWFTLGAAARHPFRSNMSGTHSDPDETEPPKRQFSFKPTEFERANRRLDEKDSNPPIDVKALYQASTVPRPAGAKVPSAPAENEVHAILKANLATANAAGENDLELRPKRLSRRKRDYWLLMLVANAFFGGMLIVLPGIGKVFGLAGMILCNLGLTWVMWFVMDDY